MEYRRINESHLAEITEMYIEAFNAPPWNDRWTAETAAKRLRQMMHCDGFIGLASFTGTILSGVILGNIEYFYDRTQFHVKEFCVHPRFSGAGIGTSLLRAFEVHLLEHGVDEVYLITSRTDQTEWFYQKRGFTSWDGMVLMRKALSATNESEPAVGDHIHPSVR